jgi:hypothetical protein
MIVNTLKHIGLVAFAASMLCTLISFFYVKPGRSWFMAFMRGSFHVVDDFVPVGQRFVRLSRWLGLIAIVLLAIWWSASNLG